MSAADLIALICVPAAGALKPEEATPRSRVLLMRDGEFLAARTDGSRDVEPLGPAEALRSIASSPDGRYVAYAAEADGSLHILEVPTEGPLHELQVLRPGLADAMQVAWSPDGGYLAVGTRPTGAGGLLGGPGRSHRSEPNTGDDLLRVVNLSERTWVVSILSWRSPHDPGAGSSEGEAGLGPSIMAPLPAAPGGALAWAPTSKALAWIRPAEPGGAWSGVVALVDLATEYVTDIAPAQAAGIGAITAFDWNPDGRSLALLDRWSGDIRQVPADGGGSSKVLVPDNHQYCDGPQWSPAGRFLAFARSRGTSTGLARPMDLWVLDLDAGEQTNLTRGAVSIMPGTISWSPDGASIAFYGSLPGSYPAQHDLYVAKPTSRAVELLQERCDVPHFSGAWSPMIPWLVPLDG